MYINGIYLKQLFIKIKKMYEYYGLVNINKFGFYAPKKFLTLQEKN